MPVMKTAMEIEMMKNLVDTNVLDKVAFDKYLKNMMYPLITPTPSNGHAGPSPASFTKNYVPTKAELMRVLGVRLRVREGEMFPAEFIDFHIGKEKVFVFIVKNDTAVLLEDDLTLFPSDTLITAIKLLDG